MMLLLLKSEAQCLARQQWQITSARGAAPAMALNAQRTTAERFSPMAGSTQSLIAILRRLVVPQLPFGVEGHL
jgi:hypothetical protein